MRIRNTVIQASRWPWQRSRDSFKAPLNPTGARFGGGWAWKFGIAIGEQWQGRRTIMLELGWGMITIRPSRQGDR